MGEIQEYKPMENNREIVINTLIIGAGGLTVGFIANYVGFTQAPTSGVDMLVTMLGAVVVAGGNTLVDRYFQKSWSTALKASPGSFIGYMVGYNLGHVAGELLK